jgi:hypothetical protein
MYQRRTFSIGGEMKLKFLRGYKPKGSSPDIPTYKEGEVYEFNGPVSEGYADKYVRLGLAEVYVAPKVEAPKPAEVAEPKDAVSRADYYRRSVDAIGKSRK